MREFFLFFSAVASVTALFPMLVFPATIKGKISPPGRCRAISAVDRGMLKTYEGKYSIAKAAESEKKMTRYQATPNPATGEFTLTGLLPGTYDLILELGDATLEGVNLNMDFEDQTDEPLTDEDKQEVKDYIEKTEFFENKVRALYVEGNGKYCKALMIRIRDKPFHADQGENILRADVWIFEKQTGAWVPRRASGKFLVLRERMKADLFKKVTHVFDPKLGGIKLKKENDEATISYTVPDKIGPEMGKVAE